MSDLAASERRVTKLEAEVNRLTRQLKEKANALVNQKTKTESALADYRKEKEETRRLNAALSALKAQSSQNATLMSQYKTKAEEAEQAMAAVIGDMGDRDKSITRLKEATESRDEMIAAKDDQLTQLKQMFRVIQGEADEGKQKAATLAVQLEEARVELGDVKPRLEEVTEQLTETTACLETAQAGWDADRTALIDLEGLTGTLRADRESLEKRLAASEAECGDLRQRQISSDGAADTANTQLQQLRRQLIAQTSREDSLRQALSSLEDEVEDLRAEAEERAAIPPVEETVTPMRRAEAAGGTEQLLGELERKERLLRWYISRERTGMLSDGDQQAFLATVAGGKSEKRGLLRFVKKGDDRPGTDELDHTRKVLDEMTLRNIALQENVEAMGAEVARLTTRLGDRARQTPRGVYTPREETGNGKA